MKLVACAALPLLALCASPAVSAELFRVSGTVTDTIAGTPRSQAFDIGFDNAEDAIQFVDTTDFNQVVPFYRDDISAINGSVSFRGVPINLTFGQNSRTVNFSVPSIGLTQTFTGVDRDDALEQLGDYLLENSSSVLRAFQRQLIKASPNDPTAGNPNSLQSMQIANDFALGGFDGTGTTAGSGATNTGENKIFFGVNAGQFTAQGVKGQVISAPLAYTVRFDADPRRQLQFSLPLTYINQSGAKTGAASLGLGFQIPMSDAGAKNQWYLTPRATAGVTGSVDAAAASILANFSLTSRYVLGLGDNGDSLTIANMVAYNKSIPFHVDDFDGDYRIKNLVFKNGLQYQHNLAWSAFGSEGSSIQASYAYTRFTGTDLYMMGYHDVSLSIGTLRTGGDNSIFRIGINGSFGENYKKVALGFGYTF